MEVIDISEVNELKVVMSLLSRLTMEVEQLREEVELLKKQKPVQSSLSTIDHEQQAEGGKITLSSAREHIKQEITKRYPALTFTHGSRVSKTKFTLSNHEETINTLIRTSKSYREHEGYPSGWFVLKRTQLTEYPLTFFVVEDFQGDYHTLIVPQEGLALWAEHKREDINGNVHFYINLIDHRVIDDRDGLNYDATRYYQNWSLILEAFKTN